MTDHDPAQTEVPAVPSALILPHVAAVKGFGTFTGVFTPTLLTILGVIMFIRLGWMVGNAGLAGSILIMAIAMGITAATGLSLSSIATNTRLGAGGPYAMITKSLGLEVGGSIGLPLYLTRPLGVAMYIFGFREGWLWIFPDHPALVIDLCVFCAVFGLSFLSADLAFRVQYLIMGVIALSIASILLSPLTFEGGSVDNIQWWGSYPGFPEEGFLGADFWICFAVFFPATTGILAGANMSGDLRDPRRSIARGTLWAIVVSTVLYVVLAVWAAWVGSPEKLATNYNFFIDEALWGPAVLAGLLGATFSSALAGAVGGPRILMAMAQHQLLPKSAWLAARKNGGEPRNAVALTALLTLVCLMARDLNVIAPLVTMFFLITYCTINVVLLVEQSLGLVSFRPTLRVPIWVPFLGTLGSIFTMFVVNATFGLVAVGCVVAVYWYLTHQGLRATGDSRSAIFAAIAEWGAARTTRLGHDNARAWKPSVLIPVERPNRIRGEYQFIVDIVGPEGAIKLIGVTTTCSEDEMRAPLAALSRSFLDDKVLCTHALYQSDALVDAVAGSLQALQSAFIKPNLLFLSMPRREEARDDEFAEMIIASHRVDIGVLLLGIHPEAGFGQRRTINIWLRRSPLSWDAHDAFVTNNLDLILLMAYRIMQHWGGADDLNVCTAISEPSEQPHADAFLADICDLARIPGQARRQVVVGNFAEALRAAPQADLTVMGIAEIPDFEAMRMAIDISGSSCLFVEDSGLESARA